jgi:hypothetical protein
VQLRLEPVRRDPLDSLKASGEVAALRSLLKNAARGRLPANAGQHVRSVAGDLTSWQKFSLPGGPLPVPRPEAVGRLLQSSGDFVSAFPLVFGNIAGFAASKVTDASLESFGVTAILQPTPKSDESRDADRRA